MTAPKQPDKMRPVMFSLMSVLLNLVIGVPLLLLTPIYASPTHAAQVTVTLTSTVIIVTGTVTNVSTPTMGTVAVTSTAAPIVGTATQRAGCHTFTETGKTVCGKFLEYWITHGQVAQQGFPLTCDLMEVSDTDGKTYRVQYFERAVFEHHPEFKDTPSEVLLSLLGVFYYDKRYPNGAPGELPISATAIYTPTGTRVLSTATIAATFAQTGCRTFSETGQRVCGNFLVYWNEHGGLAQQGYPISGEFTEISNTDDKPYTVQYFERAVFELHPENTAPNDVLLSLLGAFRYADKYNPLADLGCQPPLPALTPTPVPPTVPPTNTRVPPSPTVAPTAVRFDCTGSLPTPTSNMQMQRTDGGNARCGPAGKEWRFLGSGFTPNEALDVYLQRNLGQDRWENKGARARRNADAGRFSPVISIVTTNLVPGDYRLVIEAVVAPTQRRAIGPFRISSP